VVLVQYPERGILGGICRLGELSIDPQFAGKPAALQEAQVSGTRYSLGAAVHIKFAIDIAGVYLYRV
jgi:hypothetical protein